MIDTTFGLTESEFVEAQKIWCSREFKKVPGRLLLLSVSTVFGGFIGFTLHLLPIWLAFSIAMSLLSTSLVGQWRKRALRLYQYRLRSEDMRNLHVQIDASGYKAETAGKRGGWMSWDCFTGWIETPRIFILGSGLSHVTIPKSALTADQSEELRSLLHAHLS